MLSRWNGKQQQQQQQKHTHAHFRYIKSAVTRNYSEKSINSILDRISANTSDMKLLKDFYEATLAALQEAKNDRLWFKTNLKLGKVFTAVLCVCVRADETNRRNKQTKLTWSISL